MSSLDDSLDVFGRKVRVMVVNGLDMSRYDKNKADVKEEIKELMRTLIEETFSKDDTKAYELWKKIEEL